MWKSFFKEKVIPFLRLIGKPVAFFIDIVLIPITFVSGYFLFFYRWVGSKRFPLNTKLLKKIGIFPIRDNFYEPLFNDIHLKDSFQHKRILSSIDFKLTNQLSFLKQLNFQEDFNNFLKEENTKKNFRSFSLKNGSYGPGDAEFLYSFLRYSKPSRVIEIGSGNSTYIIKNALFKNKLEGISSEHICIEPFKDWLDNEENITIIKEKLEDTDFNWKNILSDGDFLFIDSSHMIRPQGDVLYEYLEIIPVLKPGVFVHIHDIFSPNDYPESWIKKDVRFWNEQYLLEALLTNNERYEIIASLNFLKHSNFDKLKIVCSSLDVKDEPGAFYFKIIK